MFAVSAVRIDAEDPLHGVAAGRDLIHRKLTAIAVAEHRNVHEAERFLGRAVDVTG